MVAALEKGDLAAARAASGRDVKIPKVTEQAFIAISKRERKLKDRTEKHDQKVAADRAAITKAKDELARDSTKFANDRRAHEQRFGYAVSGERAWQGGDMVAFARSVERMAGGASLATITQRIASMSLGNGAAPSAGNADPLAEDRKRLADERAALDKRKRDEAEAKEREQQQRTHAEQRATALGKFGEKHAQHPFLANPDEPGKADPEALGEAFGLFEKRWTEWRAGKRELKPTPKGVLDELHQREVRRLKRLGLTPAAPAAAAPAPAAAKPRAPAPPPPRRLPEPPRTNAPPPSRDDTRASRIALARKVTEQQMRGVRPA